MAAHRYWRLITNATNGNWGGPQLYVTADMQLRDEVGTNQAYVGNGTASGDPDQGSGAWGPGSAFDNNLGTAAATNRISGGWIQWDFGAGNAKDIQQIALTNASFNPTYAVRSFRLQYSDDGSTWFTWATVSNRPSAVSYSETYSQDPPSSGGVTLPMVIAQGSGGSAGAALLPALLAVGYGPINAAVTLPRLKAQGFGHNSEGENAGAVRLRGISAGGYCGANAALTLPFVTVSAVGTGTSIGVAKVTLPALTASATGTTTATAVGKAKLPSLNVIGYSGAVLSVTLGKITATGSGKTGGVGKADITLPLFEVSATGTVHGLSSGDVTLPAITAAPSGAGWVVLPGFVVTAVGTATVAATYEAYALNLNHNDPAAVDEMTRYTNFPFTHVVRYKNSYFGVNETGLYLLEGTTDYAEPAPTAIPWAFKTTLTDFKSPFIKTVVSTYFAGRLGPDATIDLYVGEDGAKTYSYQTPRTSTAKNFRQKFGRGNDARYYALGASGDGELALDAIEFNTLNHSRRI